MNPPPSSGEAWRPRVVTLTAAALWSLVVLWAVSSLWYPFGWDQGIFAWVGDTILRGGMPYRDAFDLKGPAAHVIFAVAQVLFGHNQWGIRVLDLAGVGAAAWLVARVARRYTAPGEGHWAAALLILWYAGLTFWHTAQPDGFAASLLCLGFLPLFSTTDSRPGFVAAAWAGAAVGLAVAIKPFYAAFLLVPTIVIVGRMPGAARSAVARVAAMTLATAAVVAGFVAWFALRGALDDLFEVHIAYNASTYSSGGSLELGPRLKGFFEYVLSGNMFVVLLPAAVIGLVVLRRTDRVAAAALATWAVLAILNVVFQNKFFAYQWSPLFAPLVILGAVGLHSAAASSRRDDDERAAARLGSGLGVALFYVVLVHATVHPAFEVLNWATHVLGVKDRAAYYDTFGVPGNDYRMSEHLRSVAQPGDSLFVMAWNVEILYTSGLEPVSRFGYSLPFWMGDGSDFQARYRREVMEDLVAHPPTYVVVAPQALPLVGRAADLGEFPEFDRFLAERYAPDVKFGELALYRLR